ncbi:MAG: NAD(P)H-hydrate dehydratase [Flavitalea sp.]
MLILTSAQIREWDEFTIKHEPIASIDLMERAALACCDWLASKGYENRSFSIFCGKGNNGGDGLAIARILSGRKHAVTANILEFGHKGTEDFQTNLARLHETQVDIRFISSEQTIPFIPAGELIIDALLGSGLNRPLDGLTAMLVNHINQSGNEIISIDIPSGLSAEHSSKGNTFIAAAHTLSFQCFKPAFLFAENELSIGELHVLDIGLHKDFEAGIKPGYLFADHQKVSEWLRPRRKFANKGNFGHALLIAGSYGKIGAAVLSARACIRSGSGLLSVHIPGCGYNILQGAVPEAMVIEDEEEMINSSIDKTDLTIYKAVGIGPGIGQDKKTAKMLINLFNSYPHPMVIDADALNIIAAKKEWLKSVPQNSIFTPHPKEFDRLFGESKNDADRLAMAAKKAEEHNIIIILKGHYTFIAAPGGEKYFNTTGNAGMAKGGSGDALTGMVTAMLAQGYAPLEAAVLAVFLHGLAGDLSSAIHSMEAMTASDLIDSIGKAFLKFY